MSVFKTILLFFMLFSCITLYPESFRTIVSGNVEVNLDNITGSSIPLGINNSVVINMGSETRFFKGIEIEISAPQSWLSYKGSVVMALYTNLERQTTAGISDIEGRRIAFEPLPPKLQIIYHIPVRQPHGLKSSPYVTIPTMVTPPSAFPVLFRLMPAAKGLSDELERMVFNFTVRPILSDEGAAKLILRYPSQLKDKPITILIDDAQIDNLSEMSLLKDIPLKEILLKEGEHHLVILSEDYRNESRRFVIERAKILELIVDLQDPTPVIIFEGPENALIFLDNAPVPENRGPIAVTPGLHEAKFSIGDYTIIKTINIQRGKTYRVALTVDLSIQESE